MQFFTQIVFFIHDYLNPRHENMSCICSVCYFQCVLKVALNWILLRGAIFVFHIISKK